MEDQVIADTILKLADKLGIAVEEVARIFIEAQPKLAIINMTVTTVSLLLLVLATVVVWKTIRSEVEKKEKRMYREGQEVGMFDGNVILPTFVVAFVIMFILLVLGESVTDCLTKLYLPEYAGLKEMVSFFAQ